MTVDPKFWNDLAEQYAAKPVEDPEAFDRKIAITRDLMKPDDVVLDIGCGTGSLALRLCDAAGQMHGLDLSDEMIRIARDKTVAAGVDNLTFHVGPFDEGFTVFEDGGLDGLCAYSILHLVPDLTQALAQIHRLVKPGGFFVSSTVVLGGSWFPYSAMLGVMRWAGKAPYVRIISVDDLVKAMEDAGFVDVTVTDVGAKSTVCFIVARKPA